MHPIQSFVAFLGRALLSIIFISSGIHKIADWQPTLQLFNQTLTDWLAISVGDSFFQPLIEWGLAHSSGLLVLGVLFELVGGLLVFLGFWVRLGSLLLIVFLIPATLAFHHFWALQGDENQAQMIQFMKNVSITGGLLYLLAMGKGRKCPDRKDPATSA